MNKVHMAEEIENLLDKLIESIFGLSHIHTKARCLNTACERPGLFTSMYFLSLYGNAMVNSKAQQFGLGVDY